MQNHPFSDLLYSIDRSQPASDVSFPHCFLPVHIPSCSSHGTCSSVHVQFFQTRYNPCHIVSDMHPLTFFEYAKNRGIQEETYRELEINIKNKKIEN